MTDFKKHKEVKNRNAVHDTLVLMGSHANAIHLQNLVKRLGFETEYTNTEETIKLLQTNKNKNRMATPKRTTPARAEETSKDFPKGIICFNPHDNAPDFVLGNLVINKDELEEWLNDPSNDNFHDNKKYGLQLKLDILKSKSGDVYLKINRYGIGV